MIDEMLFKEMVHERVLAYLRKHKVNNIYAYFNEIWDKRVSIWQKQSDLYPLFSQVERLLSRKKWEVKEIPEKIKQYLESSCYEDEKIKKQFGIKIMQDFLNDIGVDETVLDYYEFNQVINGEHVVPVVLEGNKRINVRNMDFLQYCVNMKKEIEEIKQIVLIVCYRIVKSKER